MPIQRPTPEQKAEVGAFLQQLYELSGETTVTGFASRAGLYGSNVGEYLKGDAMPNGYTVLRLMRSVDVEITARGTAVDLPEGPGQLVPRRELQAAVDDLVEWQPDVIAKLQQLETRLAQLESVPASRRTNQGKG